ncbi:MAG TPA: hypothetical protein VGC42_05485 [Kofleriaceae bacterium]
MIATRPATALTSHSLPQAVDAFVGGALELVIHSVEAVRARVMHAMRRAQRQI